MIQIPLTAEEFRATADRLRAQHKIEIVGEQGVIEKFGVKADYAYANGILSVTILDKPFFLSVEQCEKQLRGWLAGSKTGSYAHDIGWYGTLFAGPSALIFVPEPTYAGGLG